MVYIYQVRYKPARVLIEPRLVVLSLGELSRDGRLNVSRRGSNLNRSKDRGGGGLPRVDNDVDEVEDQVLRGKETRSQPQAKAHDE